MVVAVFPPMIMVKNFCTASSLLHQCRKSQKAKMNIFKESVPVTDETVSCSKRQNKVTSGGLFLRASGK
jgi:hypothetical protein